MKLEYEKATRTPVLEMTALIGVAVMSFCGVIAALILGLPNWFYRLDCCFVFVIGLLCVRKAAQLSRRS
jgi:uncharacterized membrane protein